MANTPQSPNSGKSNAGEKAPDAANLNMSSPLSSPSPLPPPVIQGQGVASPATMDKGKEVMVEASQPPPNSNKRKSIVLGAPAHHPDERVPKIPRTGGLATQEKTSGDDENIPPSLRQENRGTIVNPIRANTLNVPQVYICDFCNKRFPSAQALGGHQNGHKHERQMRSEIEAMNKVAMEQQTLPTSLMAFSGAYGPSFTPMSTTNQFLPSSYNYGYNNNNNNMMMNPMMMGYGNHHQPKNGVPINGTFQHGVNYLNPGYQTGYYNNVGGYYGSYGALGSGYGGAIYHPQRSLYNYPEFETGNHSGGGGSSYYGAFQQPNPVWINEGGMLIPSTAGYYVGINNNNNSYGLYQGQVADAMAYGPQQQRVNDTLSMNDNHRYQNTGTHGQQQVAMVGMGSGPVPEERDVGHGGPQNIQEEEEGAIDLTLRL